MRVVVRQGFYCSINNTVVVAMAMAEVGILDDGVRTTIDKNKVVVAFRATIACVRVNY